MLDEFILAVLGLFVILVQSQASLTVQSRPEILLGDNRRIVEGSSIWLYCEVNSRDNALSTSWIKNGSVLEEDVPHIRMRSLTSATTSSSMTFLLVIDNFESTDSGGYQCVIQLGVEVERGSLFSLTASSSDESGDLRIVRKDDNLIDCCDRLPDNRTIASIGSRVTFSFVLGRVPDASTTNTLPSLQWLKNGIPVRSAPVNTPMQSTLDTRLSFVVQESDAGDYQCIFYNNGTEVFYATPTIRLDTGTEVVLEPVSPSLLVIQPPEDLVIKVRARGPYERLNWTKNGSSLSSTSPSRLTQFFETLFIAPSTPSDFGLYEVNTSSEAIRFIVSDFVNATAVIESSSITINETAPITITCIATGVPAPNITWTFNNQTSNLQQTVMHTEVSVSTNGHVTLGRTMSTLHLDRPVFPIHHGLYTCTGRNRYDSISSISAASAFVDIHAAPVVQVTSNPSRLLLGESVSLECSIQKGNPHPYSYTWKNLRGVLSTGQNSTWFISSVSKLDLYDVFTCEVYNGVGRGINSTVIKLGVAPNISAGVRTPGPVPLGSTQVLTCTQLQGDPPDMVIWRTPSNKTLIPSGKDNRITVAFTTFSSYGNYACIASNRFGTSESIVVIREPGQLFQLRLLNIRSCAQWVETNRPLKLQDVAQEISKDLRVRCGCEIDPAELITKAGFKCFQSSANRVTYRAQLNGLVGTNFTSSHLLALLKEFVRSRPFLLVQGLLLRVDEQCPVAIDLRNEPECGTSQTVNPTIIIGASVGGALGVTSLILCALCMLCIFIFRKRQKRSNLTSGYPLTKTVQASSYKYNSPDNLSTGSSQIKRSLEEELTSGLDRTTTAESVYYSKVDSNHPTTPSKQPSLAPLNDFTVSQCPAYKSNSRENSLEVNDTTTDYTYSLNDAYGNDITAGRRQSSSQSSKCEIEASPEHQPDEEECYIYQCPAYHSNELEEVAVGSYHYARSNAFFMDEDGNVQSADSSHYVT